MISKLINGISSDHDLIELSNKMNIHIDVIDEIDLIDKIDHNKTYLILLRLPQNGVGHWVCCHNGHYFDAYGIGPPRKLKVRDYNKNQYQGVNREFCGIWCLLFLYCIQNDRMHLFKKFIDMNIEI